VTSNEIDLECCGEHMTTSEVAGFARVCVETVRRHVRQRRLRTCGGVGRKLVFDRVEVLRWFRADACRVTAMPCDERSGFVREQLQTAWTRNALDQRNKARRSS